MVSQINYSSIDATYPIAGKDNDSQGFRDNFGYIKSGLEIAQGEITSLQDNAAVTSGNNNFNNNQISGAVFLNNSDLFFDGGSINVNTAVPYSSGPYQKYTIAGGPLTLNLSFPTNSSQVFKMRVELLGVGSPFAVGFGGTGSTIITNNFANPVYITSTTRARIFDIWTYDAGTNVYIYELNDHESFYDNGSVSTSDTFLYSSGAYQQYVLTGNTTLTVGGFPISLTAGKIRLEVYSDGGTYNATFAAINNLPSPTAGTIKMSGRVPDPIVINSDTDPLVFEFWSHDGGDTVFMDCLGYFS